MVIAGMFSAAAWTDRLLASLLVSLKKFFHQVFGCKAYGLAYRFAGLAYLSNFPPACMLLRGMIDGEEVVRGSRRENTSAFFENNDTVSTIGMHVVGHP